MQIEQLFDEAARARVAEAVRRAEARSRGQVVPMVVEKSDAYPEARFRGALLGAALVTAAVLLLELPLTLAELPAAQAAGGLLGGLLAMWVPLERHLVGRRALAQAVRSRALRAFHEEGLQRTAEGTGVLVFASLLERQAVVLGDHGIHARMGEEGWDEAVRVLAAGLRRGAPGDGFVEAIERCGARLEAHFPREPAAAPPRNELPDALRLSRS
jgi:putative membrane protein